MSLKLSKNQKTKLLIDQLKMPTDYSKKNKKQKTKNYSKNVIHEAAKAGQMKI